MAQVYALKLDSELSEAAYQLLITKVAGEKRNKILSFFRKEDALRCLFADLLIRYILAQDAGLKNEDIVFEYNYYGKPSVAGLDGFQFNISHSGEWIVCITDKDPVGIDIELVAPIDMGVADAYFSNNEKERLFALEPAIQLPLFYELWKLKESYVKWNGGGLSIPLNTFSIIVDEGKNIRLQSVAGAPTQVFFKQYDIDERYKMAACSIAPSFRDIVAVSMREIIGAFGSQ